MASEDLAPSASQMPEVIVDDPVGQWTTAEKETREAAKWFIVTLGGIAAVVFGAGPIFLQTTYDFSSDWPLLLAETLAAIAALTAVTYMVKEISNILVPRKIDLAYIAVHHEIRQRFDGAPDIWYPTGISSFEDFRRDLAELREGAALLASAAAFNDSVASSTSESTNAELSLPTQTAYLISFEEAYRTSQDYGKRLVAEASLQALQTRFLVGPRLKFATIIAVIGTVIFIISLSIKPTESDAPAPQVALLAKASSSSSADLWNYLDLQLCESKGVVPVLLLGREATGAKVQTISWNSNCRTRTLLVTDELGELLVEYPDTSAPSTTPIPSVPSSTASPTT